MKRKTMALTLFFDAALLLASCAAAADSQVDHASIEERLEALDAYKQTIPVRPAAPDGLSALSFRGVAFGPTAANVKAAETQPLSHSFSNAVDYAPVSFYSYSMHVTCWFNESGQLYSGSYSMQHSEYAAVVQDIQARLAADHGQPAKSGYYDFGHNDISFASEPDAQAAIEGGDAYYYESYNGAGGLTVELYVQGAGVGGYEFYIYFTDPAFMHE